jgi:hypothetical protein
LNDKPLTPEKLKIRTMETSQESRIRNDGGKNGEKKHSKYEPHTDAVHQFHFSFSAKTFSDTWKLSARH